MGRAQYVHAADPCNKVPPRVTAAPMSSSVKVIRARRGTAAAMWPMSVVRIGGMGTVDID